MGKKRRARRGRKRKALLRWGGAGGRRAFRQGTCRGRGIRRCESLRKRAPNALDRQPAGTIVGSHAVAVLLCVGVWHSLLQ